MAGRSTFSPLRVLRIRSRRVIGMPRARSFRPLAAVWERDYPRILTGARHASQVHWDVITSGEIDRMSDPRPTAVRPGLWMRSGGRRVPALAAGLGLLLACACPSPARAADASAGQTRPVTLAFSG